jgi:hypothetical protein
MAIPTIDSYAQCPPEQDCGWPGDDGGGGDGDCWENGCYSEVVAQGWGVSGPWMQIQTTCYRCCRYIVTDPDGYQDWGPETCSTRVTYQCINC